MRVLSCIFILIPALVFAQVDGAQVFNANCASCHILGARSVGPDLTGVMDRQDEAWVRQFIRSPQAMIGAGDSIAMALFQEFNFVPMPDPNITDEELDAVISFISNGVQVDETKVGSPITTFIQEDRVKPKEAKTSWLWVLLSNPFSWMSILLLGLLLFIVNLMKDVIGSLTQRIIELGKENQSLRNEMPLSATNIGTKGQESKIESPT